MAHSFFFEENLPGISEFTLSEESSKHIVQVLRMKEKEEILITNGSGRIVSAQILVADKKKTVVKTLHEILIAPSEYKTTIAISLIKNSNRFEWLIEKATEIGVSEIIPIICKRTEKTHFRLERMKSIAISAMLQSGQAWVPQIALPVKINEVLNVKDYQYKFIAHCIKEEKKNLNEIIISKNASRIILIGPEGDFTEEEVRDAIQQNFLAVALGDNRLRTETAGLVAAVLLK